MAVPLVVLTAAMAGPGVEVSVPVVTRPRGRASFLLPMPLAAATGLAAGWSPHLTLVVAAAVVSAVVLATRVEWAALALVGGAVFEGYLSYVSPWAMEWLVAVLLVAWAIRRAQGPMHDHRLVAAALPAVALADAVFVAFVVHPNGVAGLQLGAKYAELAVVMMVLADVLCGPLAPRRAARVYVLACVAASVCGLVTAAVSDRHVVVGPVASPDALAFFLIAAVPLVGTVRTHPDQPTWRVWACFAVLVLAGVGTQSRPAFIALVVMVAIAVATGLLGLRSAGALIAIVATGFALVLAVLPKPIGAAINDAQRYSDTSMSQRNDFRLAALDMTRASPVVGLGPAAYQLFREDYRGDHGTPRDRDLDTAFSTALEASAELGVLGLLAMYAVWLVPAVVARRRWLRHRQRLTAGTLLALDGLVIASLFESEQYLLPLWFLAAMALAQGRPDRPTAPVFADGVRDRTSGQVG